MMRIFISFCLIPLFSCFSIYLKQMDLYCFDFDLGATEEIFIEYLSQGASDDMVEFIVRI